MRSLVIKIRENSTIKVVSKPFSKEALVEEEDTVTFSHKCSVVVEAEEKEDQHKERAFNMPSR